MRVKRVSHAILIHCQVLGSWFKAGSPKINIYNSRTKKADIYATWGRSCLATQTKKIVSRQVSGISSTTVLWCQTGNKQTVTGIMLETRVITVLWLTTLIRWVINTRVQMRVFFFAECWVTLNVGLERYSGRATCTVCNVLHSWWRGQKNEQKNNALNPKKQCNCRLSGSSENRAFERCTSTAVGSLYGMYFLGGAGKFGCNSQYDPGDKTDRDGYSEWPGITLFNLNQFSPSKSDIGISVLSCAGERYWTPVTSHNSKVGLEWWMRTF